MHKLKPFRQYDEKDVINLFKLDVGGYTLTNLVPGGTGHTKEFWSGTAVIPKTGNDATGVDPTTGSNAYLGAIGSGDQGFALQSGSSYPEAGMGLTVAGANAANCIGLTLKPTLAYDENGEKLLYYAVKKDELQCCLPGEAVPVVNRGLLTTTGDAWTANPTVGHDITIGANGRLTGAAAAAAAAGAVTARKYGTVLAVGGTSGIGHTAGDTVLIAFATGQG